MTHTSTDQEWAEFEAWAIANNKYHVSGYNPHSDLWDAWQAARRAPVGAVPQWDGVIKPSDFIVNTFRSGGSGWVPRPDIRVRITHRPTGFFEEENAMRSAHANKAVAWQRLSDRLESLAATPQPPEAVPVVSDAQIKAVFLANGFTIKEGLTDLKPYVYQAAHALLAEVSVPAAPQAVLGWVHELKNGKLGSKFYTYEPHCDNAVRDDGGKKIAVAAPAAQGVDAQLVAFIEEVRDFTAQAVRVGSKEGEIRWDIEFGPNEVEVRGKTLREAITKAIAAQAKKGREKK